MLKTKYIALAITLGSIPLQSNAAVLMVRHIALKM